MKTFQELEGWTVGETVVTNMLKRGTIKEITDQRGCTLHVEFTETIVETYNRQGNADNGVAVNPYDCITKPLTSH